MQIHTFIFNPYEQCTYIAVPDSAPANSSKPCIIIDAGMSTEQEQQLFVQFLSEHHLTPIALLITHSHKDHICGAEWLCRTYAISDVYAAQTLRGEQEKEITLCGTRIRIFATPGHKEDCVCFFMPDAQQPILFSGDTLFRMSVGRTDLIGGNWGELQKSLAMLMRLPENTIVYPGHGEPTSIAQEMRYNPYIGR